MVGSPHSSWRVISEWAHLHWGPGLLWRASNTVQLSPPPAATISLHQVSCRVSLLLALHLPSKCDQSAYRSQCACISVHVRTLMCICACGLVPLYLCMCVHVHVYLWDMHLHVCVYMGDQRPTLGICLSHLHFNFWVRSSCWAWGLLMKLGWLGNEPKGSCLHSAGTRSMHHCTWHFIQVLGTELGSTCLSAGTWQTKLCPQPLSQWSPCLLET